MKKWIIPAICAACAVFLIVSFISNHKGVTYTSIGTTYNKFLFFPEKSAHFTITFRSPYTGNLTLIDDKEKPLPDSKYTIAVDGKNSGASFFVKDHCCPEKFYHKVSCSKVSASGTHAGAVG